MHKITHSLRADGNGIARRTFIPARRTGVFVLLAAVVLSLFAAPVVVHGNPTPGPVIVWGNNTYGQTNVPANATNAVALASGWFHTLALLADGSVAVWGRTNEFQTTVPAGTTNVAAIAAGGNFCMALCGDGRLVAWGENSWGQTNVPAGATNVISIAAGANTGYALTSDKQILIWGYGAVGYYDLNVVPSTTNNPAAIVAREVSAGVLNGDQTVTMWGYGGNGETNVSAGATNVVALSIGTEHSLATRGNGSVVGWGYNFFSQATPPSNVTNVLVALAGDYFSGAINWDGSVTIWGSTGSGQANVPDGLTAWAMTLGVDHVAVIGSLFLNDAPVIECPADAAVSTTEETTEVEVTVGVQDENGDELQIIWSINGTPNATNDVAASGGGATDTNITTTLTFPLGSNSVSVSVSDGIAEPVECEFEVVVTHDEAFSQLEEVQDDVDELQDDTTPGPCSNKLARVSAFIDKAAVADNWADSSHLDRRKGRKSMRSLISATDVLDRLIRRHGDCLDTNEVQAVVDKLLALVREVAVTAIDEAEAADGKPRWIAAAQREVNDGDDQADDGKPRRAISSYYRAWRFALQAGGSTS